MHSCIRTMFLPLCLSLLLSPVTARARISTATISPASGHVATVRWNGLSLKLTVSGGDLPKNALVRARVTVTNNSKRKQQVSFLQCDTGPGSPDLQVLNDDGSEAPLPRGLKPLVSCGPPFGTTQVPPGGYVSQTNYLVLAGDVVQGSAHIGTGGSGAPVMTATLHLKLRDEPSPKVQIHSTAPVSAQIQPPAGASGTLHYKSWTACFNPPGGLGVNFTFWRAHCRPVITPQGQDVACATWEWHAVAGWLNEPVSLVDDTVETPAARGS